MHTQSTQRPSGASGKSIIMAIVPSALLGLVKESFFRRAEIVFGSGYTGADEGAEAMTGVDLVVLDPCWSGSRPDIAAVATRNGVRFVIVLEIKHAVLSHLLDSAALSPVDILFDEYDGPDRLVHALNGGGDRRWPIQMVLELAEHLEQLDNDSALHCVATILGALRPRGVEEFCRIGRMSESTAARKFAGAGFGSLKMFLNATRIIRALDRLRHAGDLTAIARAYEFGSVRALHHALETVAATTIAELRAGLPPHDVLSRAADAVRGSYRRNGGSS